MKRNVDILEIDDPTVFIGMAAVSDEYTRSRDEWSKQAMPEEVERSMSRGIDVRNQAFAKNL